MTHAHLAHDTCGCRGVGVGVRAHDMWVWGVGVGVRAHVMTHAHMAHTHAGVGAMDSWVWGP